MIEIALSTATQRRPFLPFLLLTVSQRRRRSLDRGFVLSDHADWPGLMTAIRTSGATRVWVTHGYRGPVVEWLKQQGLDAQAIETRFEGEQDETGADPAESEP